MPKNLYTLFVPLLLLLPIQLFGQHISPKVKRILFLGNSITWAAGYVNDVEAYLTVHYPGRRFEFINAGLPSETVSGLSEPGHAVGAFPRPDLHERLRRVLEQTRPDLVFACYGMNDGIYLPFDETRFNLFKDGINWLHNEVVKTGAEIIHLTPPVFDELRGGDAGYAQVLDRYADWLLSMRSSTKWEVIDIHYPMKKYLEAHRRVDVEFKVDGFALAEDGIHPNEAGHWIMARQILLYFGCTDAANSSSIVRDVSGTPNGVKILKLVIIRQNLMRDAWLSATGHKRPGMPTGLPLSEAEVKSDSILIKIDSLVGRK